MAAYWMACYGVNARIIDKRAKRIMTGHADGLRMRTLELFDSMGIQDRVMEEAHMAVEANFWVRASGYQQVECNRLTLSAMRRKGTGPRR